MDADEYLKRVAPAARRSRLAPYLADLLKLQTAGYTLEQMRGFLNENGVQISVAGLSAYLRRQAPASPAPASTPPAKTGAALPLQGSNPDLSDSEPPAPDLAADGEPDLRKRGEAVADRYMSGAASNPLLKKKTKPQEAK